MFARNRKCPPIAQKDGTIFRKATVYDHFDTLYHAVKAFKLKSLSTSELSVDGSIEIAISKGNEALSDKIGGFMILVYYDAKRLTLSANSFPGRAVVAELSNKFKFNADINNYNPSLQYLTPRNDRELLKCIVESERKQFSEAISLRCDGSIDRTQIDNQFVLLKVVNKTGEEKLYILGAAEPTEGGTKGMYAALEKAFTTTLGDRNINDILPSLSSSVTDSKGFLQFLITFENLEMLAFLADILIVFSKFQKNLQADNITIVDMERLVDIVKVKIDTMKDNPLLGGWLICMRSQIEQNQQK